MNFTSSIMFSRERAKSTETAEASAGEATVTDTTTSQTVTTVAEDTI